jgi:3-oxoacyl-[acyl-carrier protein] reductase
MSRALDGRRALVTGAARGIGLAVARTLVADGARVLMADRDGAALSEAAATLGQPAWSGDLTTPLAGDEVVAAAVKALGGLDIIINNAGAAADASLRRMTDATFQAMLDLHTVAPFRILRAAARPLRESAARGPRAKVVNVSSIIGTMGAAGGANYAAGKAGLIGLTKSLAKEWGRHGICVNAVAFGYIDTDLSAGLPERIQTAALRSIPLGRFGTTAEAAGPLAFLCSPASDYITGQVLTVSGGAALGMSS